MTGAVALLLMLTGFQIAFLLAKAASPPAGQEQAAPADTLRYDPEGFTPIPVNINRADSVALLDIPGVGPYFASKILAYRRRLGSFAVKEQLMEIRGIDKEKFSRMAPEIEILPQDVHTRDIWSLPADSLAGHPYVDAYSARAIELYRSVRPKSAWKIDSLLEAGAISERSAKGLRLYFE